jgi:prophage maintenance system killer protein
MPIKFIDGDKRTALATVLVFLELNDDGRGAI